MILSHLKTPTEIKQRHVYIVRIYTDTVTYVCTCVEENGFNTEIVFT